ncbi:MAG TPA: hypothetical protein PLL19_00300 [Thiobacillaceae bacterium]|nr:hypothetical protein [Thiobacillaceae bacterium]HNA81071.1 hypothetical protein [Thiobacillaceae bacterium]HNF87736.1 hypothetical protein [Thiobacillaceae bacterium]HNH88042.1 hypothetical protein [Thiobacillaceae bacterium]HNI07552.1 hypothetical protein [Thiobacillaceae bacterium]
MTHFAKLFALGLAALCTMPTAQAAGTLSANCNVTVDYLYNGALVEEYVKAFVVQQGVAFVDDFSTTTRAKVFTANMLREGGKPVVAIDYFNDVGVFVSIGFDAKLVLHGATSESTTGSHATYISTGVAPTSVGGTHETAYTLVCTRA